MLNFKKVLNLRIVSVVISILFIFSSTLYSYPISEDSLRTPLNSATYGRMRALASGETVRREIGLNRRQWLQLVSAGTVPGVALLQSANGMTDRAVGDIMGSKKNLPELLIALKYPNNKGELLSLSRALASSFRKIDYAMLRKYPTGMTSRTLADPTYLENLMQAIKDIDFPEHGDVIKNLVANLIDEDIFKLIEQADLDRETKRGLVESLISCMAFSQFLLIRFLSMDIDNVRPTNAPQHGLIVRPQGGYRYFLLDFSQRIFGEIDYITEYYMREGEYWVLRRECRRDITPRLKRMIENPNREVLNLDTLSREEKESIFYHYYFYLQVLPEVNYGFTPNILNNVGHVLTILKRYNEAAKVLNKAIEYSPNYAEAHNNLGVVLAKLGDIKAAEREYKIAIRLNPSYGIARYNLGNAMVRLGRFNEAVEEYKKSIDLDPKDAEAYFNLAIAYFKLGKTDEGMRNLRRAITLKPALLNNLPEELKRKINSLSGNGTAKKSSLLGISGLAIILPLDFRLSFQHITNASSPLAINFNRLLGNPGNIRTDI